MRGLVASGSAVVWSVLENATAAARPFDANQGNKRASCWNNFCGSMNMCVSECVAYVRRVCGLACRFTDLCTRQTDWKAGWAVGEAEVGPD